MLKLLSRLALIATVAAAVGGCDEGPDVTLTNLGPCATQVSIQVSQGGFTSNTTADVSNGTASASFAKRIDFTKPVRMVVKILRTKDSPECREQRGREFSPMTEYWPPKPDEGVTIDFSEIGTLAPPLSVTGPEGCKVRMVMRDGSEVAAQDNPFTDISPKADNLGGPDAPFDRKGGKAENLGYTRGIYTGVGGNFLGIGFYKKIEVHVTVDAPCVITSLERSMETLPGHNYSPSAGSAPDPIDTDRSQHEVSPQFWYLTDAPGIFNETTEGANGKVFHKRFTVTAKGNDGGNPAQEWVALLPFDVWVGVRDANTFIPPPLSNNR